MSAILELFNRQRVRPIPEKPLVRALQNFLGERMQLVDYYLSINLVTKARMARINQTFLNHSGPTDVITFDYSDADEAGRISGELFVCVPVAVEQAKTFHSSWQLEILRYIIHGVLHLQGFDDRRKKDQVKMKCEEDRLVSVIETEKNILRCFRLRRADYVPRRNQPQRPRT